MGFKKSNEIIGVINASQTKHIQMTVCTLQYNTTQYNTTQYRATVIHKV